MSDRVSQLVDRLAAETGGAKTAQTSTGTEYLRDGRVYAAVDRAGIELRLRPDIAEAARRTPSVGPSARGGEWIAFAPPEWDQHAIDRLEAWFRVAWRLAGEKSS